MNMEYIQTTSSSVKPERLDKILQAQAGHNVSREKIKKLILNGMCTVDDDLVIDPAKKIYLGQNIYLTLPHEQSQIVPEEGDVNILFQDDFLLVIDKSPDLTVHPAPSCPTGTLVHRLLRICPELQKQEGPRPGIVHRLDKDTSGLIVVAKDEVSRLRLSEAFAERTVSKTYLALVHGVMTPAQGEIHEPIGRHPTIKTRMSVTENGRPAHTGWKTLHTDPGKQISLLSVTLHTGRTHQIRVHFAHLGFPLLGDTTYAPKNIAGLAPRQMLHAWKLGFMHPVTDAPCDFTAPVPEDMVKTILRLSGRTMRVVITGLPGCGKSLLTETIRQNGFPTWSADEEVRKLYQHGEDGWHMLHHRFRGTFTDSQGVNKTALAHAMRETPGLREEVESLLHPLIYDRLDQFWKKAEDSGERMAFAEVPLWSETAAARKKNESGKYTLIGIRCLEKIRHERLARRGWSQEMIDAADAWQLPEAEKLAACDYVIDNNTTKEFFAIQAKTLLDQLEDEAHKKEKAFCKQWF